MQFALCEERQRGRAKRRRNRVFAHRQSRWLSKERGCARGKRDRCQNKGDSKSCPDLGAREWVEGGFRPLADRGKEKWGRTVRMELDYTRQCSMNCFTMSRTIFLVFEWKGKGQRKEPTLRERQSREEWATPSCVVIHLWVIPINCATRRKRWFQTDCESLPFSILRQRPCSRGRRY